jgi:hypothetical protein
MPSPLPLPCLCICPAFALAFALPSPFEGVQTARSTGKRWVGTSSTRVTACIHHSFQVWERGAPPGGREGSPGSRGNGCQLIF